MTPSGARPEIRVPRWIKYYTQSTIVCILWILWFFGPVFDAYYETNESKVLFLISAFNIQYRLRPVSIYEWSSYSAFQWTMKVRQNRAVQTKFPSLAMLWEDRVPIWLPSASGLGNQTRDGVTKEICINQVHMVSFTKINKQTERKYQPSPYG